MGFLVAPEPLLPAIRAVRQAVDWCPPYASQLALAALIGEGHLDRHLRRCRAAYRERHRLMWAALGQLLPAGHRRLPADAGLHLTVLSPAAAADRRVWSAIERHDLLVGSLARTYQFSDPASGFLLGFGAIPTQLVTTAVRAFCTALDKPAGGHPHRSARVGLPLDPSHDGLDLRVQANTSRNRSSRDH
jgi:GntR family transcriptional regulator/MocR family aminotransferase